MVNVINFALALLIFLCVIWGIITISNNLIVYPEVGQLWKRRFDEFGRWCAQLFTRKKRKNKNLNKSVQAYTFSEYPLVYSQGLVFEVVEAKRMRKDIWHVHLNIFNADNEIKKVKLLKTMFHWKNDVERFIVTNETYSLDPASGLISSSEIQIRFKKLPEFISVNFISNGAMSYTVIPLHQDIVRPSVVKPSDSLDD